jgi:hypothetical protein
MNEQRELSKPMTPKKPKMQTENDDPVAIETKPGGAKDIGGGESEKWNFRQIRLMLSALPGVNIGERSEFNPTMGES